MLLVALLMLVLLAMDEARKPENWAWMGFQDTQADATAQPDGTSSRPEVSPRLADLFSAGSTGGTLFGALADETREKATPSGSDSAATAEGDAGEANEPTSLSEAEIATVGRVWEVVFESLDDASRRRMTEDLVALAAARDLDGHATSQREMLAGRLEQVTETVLARFRNEARQAVLAETPPMGEVPELSSIKTPWDPMLDRVAQRITGLTAMLRAGGLPDNATVGDFEELGRLREAWDRVLLAQLDDAAIGHHPSEQHAWYRVLEQLEADESAGRDVKPVEVSAYELDRQPDYYRGRWIRVSGEARRIERLEPPGAREGFERLWSLWLRPRSGPDTPICCVVRELPEGFPQPAAGEGSRDIRESVVVEGAFLKRMGYMSGIGATVTPLVLANRPGWSVVSESSSTKSSASIEVIAAALLLGAFAAIGFTFWVARVTARPKRRGGVGMVWLALAAGALSGARTEPLVAQTPPWLNGREQQVSDDDEWRRRFADFAPSELDRLGDALPLSTAESLPLQVLDRLAFMGRETARRGAVIADAQLRQRWRTEPQKSRLQPAWLAGYLESLEMLTLDEASADRFERDVVYRVVLRVTDAGEGETDPRIVLWSGEIPPSWEKSVPLGDRVEAIGVFLHLERVAEEGGEPVPMAIVPRIAWLPAGESVPLGWQRWYGTGLDAGDWERVDALQRRDLRAEDGAVLYPLLKAVGDESRVVEEGEAEERIAFELFDALGQPRDLMGRSVTLSATIKRITEIGVGADLNAGDVGIASYYQIDLLLKLEGKRVKVSDASPEGTITGSYPVTLCALRLPEGLSPSPDLDIPVSIQAVFYRNWRYRSEYLRRVDPQLRQIAPLLIAESIQIRTPSGEGGRLLTQTALAVFLIAMGGTAIGFAALRWSDLRYRRLLAATRNQNLPATIGPPPSTEEEAGVVSDREAPRGDA